MKKKKIVINTQEWVISGVIIIMNMKAMPIEIKNYQLKDILINLKDIINNLKNSYRWKI